jgi:hypothetical protein
MHFAGPGSTGARSPEAILGGYASVSNGPNKSGTTERLVELTLRRRTDKTVRGFVRRALAWFRARGMRICRVFTDNGSADLSQWLSRGVAGAARAPASDAAVCARTNGKVERFIA